MHTNINIHACSQICKHINIPVNLHTHNYTNVFQCPACDTEGGGSWPCQPDAHRNLTPVFYRLTEPHIFACCTRLNQKYIPNTTTQPNIKVNKYIM